METKRKTIIWWLELIAKLGLLTVGFLEASSLTFGKPVISLFLWPTVLLGGILVLVRLLNWKSYWKSKNFFLLLAFCISYALSTVINIRYGWYTNVRTLIWCAFLFFLVYCYRTEDSVQENEKQFRVLAVYYIAMNAVLSLLSFFFMITGHSQIYYQEVGPIYYIGFHWGRLYGAYWDANIGAVMSCVGILLSIGFFRTKRSTWIRILAVLNIVLEIFYIAFSDSRTGQLCLCVAVLFYVFLMIWEKKKIHVAMSVAFVGLVMAFLIPVGIKKTYNMLSTASKMQKGEIVQTASMEDYEVQVTKEGTVSSEGVQKAKSDVTELETLQEILNLKETQTPVQVVGRADEYSGDITNRRSDIWKSAIEIFLTSPVVGVGHNNVLAYVYENLPDSYLVTNDHMDFDSMHNVFFDILVGQGVIGILIYLAMAVLFFITIVKNWKKILKNSSRMCISCFVILMVMVTASFVMTEIVYVTSPMATVFWMSMGCLIQATGISANKGVK